MSERHLDCEQVIRHLLEYLDRELDDQTMAEMGRHLDECRGCFGRAEFERKLKESLQAAGSKRASSRLRSRIKAIIGSF